MSLNLESIATDYWRDGYVIVRKLFSPLDLEQIETNLAAYIRDVTPRLSAGDVFYESKSSKAIKSLFRMQENSEFFERFSHDPRLIAIMRAIFTEGEVLCDDVGFFGKAAREGSVTPAHQDNAFNYWTPPYCLKASLALDPATPENGAMFVQRGSHLPGVLPHRPSGVMGFSQTLIEPLDTEKYPEVQLCMSPGDLALHHTDCVHYSGANKTDQSRRMLSLVYRSSAARHEEEGYARYKQQAEELQRQHAGAM